MDMIYIHKVEFFPTEVPDSESLNDLSLMGWNVCGYYKTATGCAVILRMSKGT